MDKVLCEHDHFTKSFATVTCELLKNEYYIDSTKIYFEKISKNIPINPINFVSSIKGSVEANLIFSFSKELASVILKKISYLEYRKENFDILLKEMISEFLHIVFSRYKQHIGTKEELIFSPSFGLTGESELYYNNGLDIYKTAIQTCSGEFWIIVQSRKKALLHE